MARKLAKVSADDIFRAISGARRAGFTVTRCEIAPDGQIALMCDEPATADLEVLREPTRCATALERWLAAENAS